MVTHTELMDAVSQRASVYEELRRQIVDQAKESGGSKADVDQLLREGTRPKCWKDQLPDEVLHTVEQYYSALESLKESIQEALAVSGAPDAKAWSEIIESARKILERGGPGH